MQVTETEREIYNAEDEDEMRELIEEAIDDNDVIVFMKGNKEMPQCGYSARAVKAVSLYEDEFETVDVLRDERVREVLEDVTDWPTIPQVFVDGEFLGGSDIVVEMHEEGELEEKIQAT